MWPWIPSPLKERNYRGDIGLEAKLFSAATGMNVTTLEFDRIGVKMYLLQRALTERSFKSKNMRELHDQAPPWVFASHHPGSTAFDGSNYYLTEEDWNTALDLYYDELGFDTATGALTRETLTSYGMTDVADALQTAGLLPASPA
jgi:aldehyde:ferredoxin oxidoreductase